MRIKPRTRLGFVPAFVVGTPVVALSMVIDYVISILVGGPQGPLRLGTLPPVTLFVIAWGGGSVGVMSVVEWEPAASV